MMIFDCQSGKGVLDGAFLQDFFKKYENAKAYSENIGWTLIENLYPENYKLGFSSAIGDKLNFYKRVKLLMPKELPEEVKEEEKKESEII